MLTELLGEQAFRERVKIYATDVDEDAPAQARSAAYPDRALQHLDAALVERYFERSGTRGVFRKDLRRSVIFGRNDLVQDAPISRIDLLSCRNTLMYLTAVTQAGVLQSTVEELETTNEELQSTNEELETMNEQLRSANDELQRINDHAQTRRNELDGPTTSSSRSSPPCAARWSWSTGRCA